MVGALISVSVPTQADVGSGVSVPLTTRVVDVLQVYDSPDGQPLDSGYIFSGIFLNNGQTITKSLWVKNNSSTTDYVVTPIFSCSPVGYVSCASLISKTVTRNTMVQFDFVMTGVVIGSPTITFSFARNQ